MEAVAKVPFLKKWWISARPFSFPASTMPVIFGTVLAVVYGGYELKPLLFVLAFFGMVILHSGANILSDIFDYKKGLDKIPSPVSGGVVRGYITIREAWVASVSMLIVGTIIGLYLTYVSGPWLLAIGLLGLFVGTFYTTDTAICNEIPWPWRPGGIPELRHPRLTGCILCAIRCAFMGARHLGGADVDAGDRDPACQQLEGYPER